MGETDYWQRRPATGRIEWEDASLSIVDVPAMRLAELSDDGLH